MTAALVGGVMAEALAARRDRFNALVGAARREWSTFDTDVLDEQLRGPVGAVVEACEAVETGAGARVLAAVFGPVVELVGQRRLGGGPHDALLRSLVGLAPTLVRDPRRVFGSLANGVIQLQRDQIAIEPWLARVVRVAPSGDVDVLLRTGQVAAWAMGLAHYRDSALDLAATLPADALGAAFDQPGGLDPDHTVATLRADRWARPGTHRVPVGAVAHRVGGFRGFGGPFLAPPQVASVADRVAIASGSGAWVVHADAFGATLTRADRTQVRRAAEIPADTVAPAGVAPSGAARAGDVVVVTTSTSYEVLVIAGQDPVR